MKKLSLIICFVMFSFLLQSQWTQQNLNPTGYALNSICFTDSDTGYAVGDGILKTIDGGNTWTTSLSGNYLYSVFFTDANTGYAAAYKGAILKTIDGGTNWKSLWSDTTTWLTSVYFIDSNNGYAVGSNDDRSEGIILKTIDGGITWTSFSSGTKFNFESVFFTNSDTGYAVGDGILKTIDGGITWTTSLSGNYLQSVFFTDANTGYAVGSFMVEKTHNCIILKTIDGGTNWKSLWSDTTTYLTTVCFIDSNNGYAVGNQYNSDKQEGIILKTIDGGITWTSFSSGTNQYLKSVFFTDSNTGYAAGGQGIDAIILKTIDGGITWTELSKGTMADLNQVVFTDANRGYAISEAGTIMKTTDGGTTWYHIESTYVQSIYFSDSNTGYGVSGSWTVSFPGWDYEASGSIFKTMDGGTTWTNIWEGSWMLKAIYFTNANTGYAVGSGISGFGDIILKTIDGGATWTPQQIVTANSKKGMCFRFLNSVFFADANTGYVVGDNGTILKTTNGGNTWTSVSDGTNHDLYSVFFTDSNNGYAVGNKYNQCDSAGTYEGIVLKTIDGGITWTSFTSGTNHALFSVAFTDANTGYAIGGDQDNIGIIIKTVDGGTTWTEQPSGTGSSLNSVFFTDSNTGYIVGDHGTILKTTNGGGFPTVVENKSPALAFTIYPNPATNKITITTTVKSQGETQVSIFSINGQLIQRDKFQNLDRFEMDVSTMQKGIYLLRIQSSEGVETQKLVLQ